MVATQGKSRELAQMGVPVGWPGAEATIAECFSDNAAGTSEGTSTPPADGLVGFCRYQLPVIGLVTIPSLLNCFWLVVGGLLVGLGAPFWAQAVSSLTATRDLTTRITRTVSPGVEHSSSRSRGAAVRSPVNETPTHVRTFNVSRTSRKQAE